MASHRSTAARRVLTVVLRASRVITDVGAAPAVLVAVAVERLMSDAAAPSLSPPAAVVVAAVVPAPVAARGLPALGVPVVVLLWAW
jgi:hypothetical protein